MPGILCKQGVVAGLGLGKLTASVQLQSLLQDLVRRATTDRRAMLNR